MKIKDLKNYKSDRVFFSIIAITLLYAIKNPKADYIEYAIVLLMTYGLFFLFDLISFLFKKEVIKIQKELKKKLKVKNE